MSTIKFFILSRVGSQGTFPGKDLFPLIEPLRLADDIAVNTLERPSIRAGWPAEEIDYSARCHQGAHQYQPADKMEKKTQGVKEIDTKLQADQKNGEDTGHHSGSRFVFF